MRIILTIALILIIASPVAAEIYHKDTQQYRLESARERLSDFKEKNWDWDNYSNRERSELRAEARKLQRAIDSGDLSYREAYGESDESPVVAEVYHEDTRQYRQERARERLSDLKEKNWDWENYSSRQRSKFRAEARKLQRAIDSGDLSYREAYGELDE